MQRSVHASSILVDSCAGLGGHSGLVRTCGGSRNDVRRGGFTGAAVNPRGVQTSLNTITAAPLDGQATSATFGWSTPTCSAAAKIKFFRPAPGSGQVPARYDFIAERGPFDVPAFPGYTPQPLVIVALDPPVDVLAGDVVGITNLTLCGQPITVLYANVDEVHFDTITVPGDVTTSVTRPAVLGYTIWVIARGITHAGILLDRFEVTLMATNPRTGATAPGIPAFSTFSTVSTRKHNAGYFSIPDFTGDPEFPEVMVKMVDASAVPALGGTFWFFHAPLTDVEYTLRVTDLKTRAARTYTNTSGTPGQLCGEADTSAFPGP